jgi:MFS family permease
MAPRSGEPLFYRLGSYFEFSDTVPQRSTSHERLSLLDDVEDGRLPPPRKRKAYEVSAVPPTRIPVTTSLPILVFLDSFAVSLVVPLLFQYYRAAGVTQAKHREYLSSVFSSAQILGGLSIGFLTDSKVFTRLTILLLSFGGSAVSYALIVFGGFPALVVSRVLVGLVKHTMTIATTILSKATSRETRAQHMGRLQASLTLAWIIGPVVGSLLWQFVDRRAPALLACAIFVVNMGLALVFVPRDDNQHVLIGKESDLSDVSTEKVSLLNSIKSYFRALTSSQALLSTVAAQLLFTWVQRTTDSSQLGSFYEDMYHLEPHDRGYLSSYQEALKFISQSLLVGPTMARIGGERRATSFFTLAVALALVVQTTAPLFIFLGVVCPVTSLAYSMISLSLQSLVTHIAPPTSIFFILAALDVLQNAVSISVPFYRTWLFTMLNSNTRENAAMKGDPDPESWTVACMLHWIVAAVVIGVIMLCWHREHEDDHTKKEKR